MKEMQARCKHSRIIRVGASDRQAPGFLPLVLLFAVDKLIYTRRSVSACEKGKIEFCYDAEASLDDPVVANSFAAIKRLLQGASLFTT